jgi:hypothetical protein
MSTDDKEQDVEPQHNAEEVERPDRAETGDPNQSTEGLLDEDKLREDAREVDQAIQDAKNRNP